jgi:hypothetical protein
LILEKYKLSVKQICEASNGGLKGLKILEEFWKST